MHSKTAPDSAIEDAQKEFDLRKAQVKLTLNAGSVDPNPFMRNFLSRPPIGTKPFDPVRTENAILTPVVRLGRVALTEVRNLTAGGLPKQRLVRIRPIVAESFFG